MASTQPLTGSGADAVPIGPPSLPVVTADLLAPVLQPPPPAASASTSTTPLLAIGGGRPAESSAPLEPSAEQTTANVDDDVSPGDGQSPTPATGKLVPYPTLPTVLSSQTEEEQMQSTAYPPPAAPASLPAEPPKVALTLLLLSGQRRLVRFEPQTTIARVKELIWASWPHEWTTAGDGPPDGPGWIRVLYRGRMLDDERTLSAEGLGVLPGGRSTIVHLSVRTFPIETAEDGKDGKASADDSPLRPPLHTRASSRLRSLVGAGPQPTDGSEQQTGANGPAAVNGGAPTFAVSAGAGAGAAGAGARGQGRSGRRRSQSNATNSTADTHAGSSGCGCVIA